MGTEGRGICHGRVAIVTGAGRGLGREYAIALAREGAAVVVNDVGADVAGVGSSTAPAAQVVDDIVAAGGRALVSTDDVGSFDGARRLVASTLAHYGRLDAVVNNAGIFRSAPIADMSEADWDDVVRVHLKGTFAVTRWSAQHWRVGAQQGEPVDGRIINTTSVSGLYGIERQSSYSAAKAAVAALTYVTALELAPYGVTVNAIAPLALTRMTKDVPTMPKDAQGRDLRHPRWVAALVAWLVSPQSRAVTGRVIEASGSMLAIADGWTRGRPAEGVDDPSRIGHVIHALVDRAAPPAGMDGCAGSRPAPTLRPL